MKTASQTILERRSIRRYEREQLTDEQLEFIHEAIRHTPTSYNGQQFSVIDIEDQPLKERLYELTHQKQIKTCAHFFAFCADFHKITVAAKAKGVDMPPVCDTADGLLIGTIDASLAMMNALTAAEALGLGTCCIGYARTAAPEAIAQELGLPDQVYLVCGLAVGVPRELPDLKPKQPASLLIHRNRYSEERMAEALLGYDREVTRYNATRSGAKTDNDWIAHMTGYYAEAMGYTMLEALRRRGFDPKR